MNDAKLDHPAPTPHGESHLSEQEAVRITRQEDVPELVSFVIALHMSRPVSTDMAARLLKHMVKQQMSTDAGLIADQMRQDEWASHLAHGETLMMVADRALAYLATHDGIQLFNFFVKTFAETTGEMYD
jgi:hypothetical protein